MLGRKTIHFMEKDFSNLILYIDAWTPPELWD